MIKIVRVDGLMMIGDLDGFVNERMYSRLKDPRVIMNAPQGIAFMPLVGDPKEIDIPPCIRYEPGDQGLIAAYKAHVTGIILPKAKNVIDIGRTN